MTFLVDFLTIFYDFLSTLLIIMTKNYFSNISFNNPFFEENIFNKIFRYRDFMPSKIFLIYRISKMLKAFLKYKA